MHAEISGRVINPNALLINRCATRMHLGRFEDALGDAREVVAAARLNRMAGTGELAYGDWKAYVRGSQCLAELGDLDAAEAFAEGGLEQS